MDFARLNEQLTGLTAANRFSGVVRIETADRLLFESAYGLASPTWHVPNSPAIRFDTASITKLFTAVATLQQVDAGAFALHTGVVDYLGLAGTTLSPAITPYHLLTHTSGIADDADEEDGERYEDLFIERPNYSVIETEDHLDQFVSKPPKFAPGEGCRYNNVAYILLGLMVERATQRRYREYVKERVFAPAGMDRSGFFRMDMVEPDVAEGADPVVDDDGRVRGWHRNVYSYPPVGSPDGGAHVTAEDLARFHSALRGGRLLGPESTAAMLTPKERYKPRGTGTHMTGYGFEFETDADGEVHCYWKEGINVGASGALTFYPADDVKSVVLSNMENGAWEPIKMIDRLVTSRAV